MSLATRCTACGTIFRVVQDQLRISDGYVRCGRCAEVFDAGEQLFDIDREAPPPWPAAAHDTGQDLASAQVGFEPGPQASTAFHAPTPPGHAPWHQEEEDVLPAPDELEVITAKAQAQQSSWAEADVLENERPGQAPAHRPAAEPAFANSRLEPQWFEGDDQEPTPPAAALADPPLEDDKPDVVLSKSLSSGLASKDDAAGKKTAKAVAAAAPRSKAAPTEQAPAAADMAEAGLPEFLRKPASGGAWQRRPVRLAAGFACGVLIAGLGVQLLQQFHDAIATVVPASRPALQAYCQLTGCQIKPWRRIEQLVVESTALSQLSPGSNGNHYQLAISLRNKSIYELATPWVELSLTNASGALVGRRMLSPAEFKLNPPAPAASAPGLAAAAMAASAASAANAAAPSKHEAMAAGSELPLQILLSTGEQRVSGYSVEIFYP